jgi:predicted esterase
VGDQAFLLCVTGSAMYPYEPPSYAGYFYTGHPALGREMSAAFRALQDRFGAHVDAAEPLFAGYSQGAIMGALLLPQHPLRFSRAALIEGGFGFYQEWNVAAARRFAEQGGRRVLLACGRPRCVEQAEKTSRYLRMGGLGARVVHARGAGHSCGSIMERELRQAFGWLVEGDGRFPR